MYAIRMVLLFLSLTTLAFAAEKTLWKQKESFVSIIDSNSREPNQHPVRVSPENLATLLAYIRYENTDGNQDILFDNPKRLKTLSKYIAQGLASAKSSQDVRFQILAKRREGGFFGKLYAIGGRVFYQNKRLNIIFSELLSSYDPKILYGNVTTFRGWRDASRGKQVKHRQILLAGKGIEKKRDDWLVLNPSAMTSRARTTTTAPRQQTTVNRPTNQQRVIPVEYQKQPIIATPQSQQTVLPAQQTTSPSQQTTSQSQQIISQPPQQTQQPATTTPLSPAAELSILEARLKKLKMLKDQGLITEEAYNDKINQILKEL